MDFRYCYEKNAQLLKTRGIGFEEIIHAIIEGNILDIRKHPNEVKYPNQKIFYIRVLKEVYVVPYVEEKNNSIFLKTLFPIVN
mgnify:FL=1